MIFQILRRQTGMKNSTRSRRNFEFGVLNVLFLHRCTASQAPQALVLIHGKMVLKAIFPLNKTSTCLSRPLRMDSIDKRSICFGSWKNNKL